MSVPPVQCSRCDGPLEPVGIGSAFPVGNDLEQIVTMHCYACRVDYPVAVPVSPKLHEAKP